MKTFFAVATICLGILLIGCTGSDKQEQTEATVIEEKEIPSSATAPDTVEETQYIQVASEDAAEKSYILSDEKSVEELNKTYRQLDLKPQTFSFYEASDKEIVCSKGTVLRFEKNSFVDAETGKEVEGKIDLTVKEYYDMADILAANLGTSSKGKMLETAGMIYVDASVNGRKCKLKRGSTMEISHPQQDIKEGMQLFTGQRSNFENIDWTPLNSAGETKDGLIMWPSRQLDKAPSFPGGRDSLYAFLKREIKKHEVKAVNSSVRKAVVTLLIGADGSIKRVEVDKVSNKDLNKAIVGSMQKMPKWIPAEQNGIGVRAVYRMELNFVGNNMFISKLQLERESWREIIFSRTDTLSQFDAEEFEKNMTDSTVQTANIGSVSAYLFSSSTLGWINIDRFLKEQQNMIAFNVNVPADGASNMMVVFKNMKSVMSAVYSKAYKGYYFERLPAGEPVTLIALKSSNGKNFIAIKETTISSAAESLTFQPVTVAQIKEQLKNL